MPYHEEILDVKTNRDVSEVDRRAYYTFTDGQSLPEMLRTARTNKAIALLVKLLHEKGLMDDEELDDFLFNCVM